MIDEWDVGSRNGPRLVEHFQDRPGILLLRFLRHAQEVRAFSLKRDFNLFCNSLERVYIRLSLLL